MPELIAKEDKSLLELPARVTVIVYVPCVPSEAVTTMVIVFVPTAMLIALELTPDVTALPFTVIVFPEIELGVKLIVEVEFPTLTVYEKLVSEKLGERAAESGIKLVKVTAEAFVVDASEYISFKEGFLFI